MTRMELIVALSEEFHLPQKIVRKVVDTVFDSITETLADGGRVELRDFGVFSVTKCAAHRRVNPSNNEPLDVPEAHHMRFKAGKRLLHSLNNWPVD